MSETPGWVKDPIKQMLKTWKQIGVNQQYIKKIMRELYE